MSKINLSDSDKKLLIIFLSIVILACSYFFVFTKVMDKASAIEDQNTTDSAKVQQMEQMEAGLPQVKENIQRLRKKQKQIIKTYPSDMTTEKVIETLQAMEDENESEFHISEITFAMNMPIAADVATDTTADTSADTSADTTSTESTETADTQSTESTDADVTADDSTGPNGQVGGYYASIGIRYTANYTGLKDMILFTNSFKDRTTIPKFTATYDSSTGKVVGEMTLNMYYLTNTGKEYIPPVFENMPKGKVSIFGNSVE